MLLIPTHCYNQLVQEAIEKYPAECCGFLVGKEDGEQRVIHKIIVCKNTASAIEKEYAISAADFVKTEKMAAEKGLCLLGVYHSHPNTVAMPSATDVKNALPQFSYLILSVFKHKICSARSWRLTEESVFTEEKIIINQNNLFKQNTAYGHHHYSYAAS